MLMYYISGKLRLPSGCPDLTCCVSLLFPSSEEGLPTPSATEEKVSILTCVPRLTSHVIYTYALSHTDHMYVRLSSPQQKHQEIERVAKWLKMVKKWDKYKNSEKVCNSKLVEKMQERVNKTECCCIQLNYLYYFRLC